MRLAGCISRPRLWVCVLLPVGWRGCLGPGSTAARYSRTGIFLRRQLSMTEKIAATLGPACGLPMCIQFFLPIAMGRVEFSARLLDNSSSGYSRNRVSLFHSPSV